MEAEHSRYCPSKRTLRAPLPSPWLGYSEREPLSAPPASPWLGYSEREPLRAPLPSPMLGYGKRMLLTNCKLGFRQTLT